MEREAVPHGAADGQEVLVLLLVGAVRPGECTSRGRLLLFLLLMRRCIFFFADKMSCLKNVFRGSDPEKESASQLRI